MRKSTATLTLLLLASNMVPVSALAKAKTIKKMAAPTSKQIQENLKKFKPRITGTLGFLENQGTVDGKTEPELIDMVKSFRLLINQEKSGSNRNNYLLAEASSYLALARIYRLKANMSPVDKEREKNCNKRALKATAEAYKEPKSTLEQQTKALFYGGLAQINLGEFEGARRSFEMAIKLNPRYPQAPNMNLYISESLFEKEKYEDALRQYGVYYKQYPAPQKALAIYKMAWCHLNLQRPQSAEKLFVLLAGQSWAGAFGEDAIKDMAYISSYFRGEQEAIDFSKEIFAKDIKLRTRYLTELYMIFQSQSGMKKKPLLLAELLRIETDLAKKLRLLIVTMKSSQRGYASLEPLRDLSRIRNLLVDSHLGPTSPAFLEIGAEFETELVTLTKAYADTFEGKVKTAENLKKIDIANHMIDVLKLHLFYFPQSKEKENSYQAWLSVCSQMNMYQCIYDTSHLILRDSQSDKLKVQANLELLRALDELYKKEKKYKEELVNRLILFLQAQTENTNWMNLAKRLTYLMNEDKNYKESIPWLEKIYAKENTSENYYRLQSARFENAEFEKVVTEPAAQATDKFSFEIRKLVREAHLKLATVELEKGDFSAYEKNLKTFVGMSDDPEKADLARRNYVSQLILRKEFDKAFAELKPLPAKRRFHPEMLPLTVQVTNALLKQGQYAQSEDLLQGWDGVAKKRELEVLALTAAMGQSSGHLKKSWNQIHEASQDHRDYVLGLLALTSPSVVIEYSNKFPPKSANDKKVLLLAYRTETGRSAPQFPPKVASWLAGMVTDTGKKVGPSNVEKGFREIIFPKSTWSATKYERFTQDAVERVRRLRKRVVKDIEPRPFEDQSRILDLAINSESGVAKALNEAPVPQGLDAKEIEQYKKGVGDLASEFSVQAEEFNKIKTKLAADAKAIEDQILRVPANDRWSVPSTDQTFNVRKAMDEKKYVSALIILDQARAANEMQPEDYYRLRSMVLFAAHPHQLMADYVKQELESVKQDKILADWRSIK